MIYYSYAAYKPCGCMVAVALDHPDHRKEVGKLVAEWIAEGLSVQRVTTDVVREQFQVDGCPHEQHQLSLFNPEATQP